MMAQDGAILLHRQLRECAELAEPEALALWVHLLLMAAHKPTKTNFRKKVFQLQRGQLLSSLRQLAADTGVKIHPLRRFIELFTKTNMIKMVTATRTSGRIITICKYDDFQTLSTGTVTTTVTRRSQARHNEQESKSLRLLPESDSLPTETPTNVESDSDNMLDESTSSDVLKDGFAKFYAAYPRKVGSHRAAEKYRQALKVASHEEIMDGLRRAVQCWRRNGTDKGYIPHPATWLHGHRWADELVDMPKPNGGGDPAMNAIRRILQADEEVENGGDDPFFPGTCDEKPYETGGPRTHALEIRRTSGNGVSRLC